MDITTILIVDDHPVFRFGLKALINSLPDLEVAGEAGNGVEAIELVDQLQPDVVVLDLNMPELNGLDAIKGILEIAPATGILIITMFDDNSVFTAMQNGARGYLLKGAEPQETINAIRAVAKGEAIFSSSIAKRVIDFFAGRQPDASRQLFPELSERERSVLALIAQGFTNQSIAEKLALSHKTIRNYVSNILSKMQVANRAQAIIRARDAGLY